MVEQIVFADDIERLAKYERERKFLLINRKDNHLGYIRFSDANANLRTGQSGHKGIAAAFLEEIAQSGENIPIEYHGGGLAKFYQKEKIHLVFSGQSDHYGKFDENLLRRIMDSQTDFSYQIE